MLGEASTLPVVPEELVPDLPDLGSYCLEVGRLCTSFYAGIAQGFATRPNTSLLGSLNPSCAPEDYDPNTDFVISPVGGQQFPSDPAGDFGVYFNQQRIPDSYVTFGVNAIHFTMPPEFYNMSGVITLGNSLSAQPANPPPICGSEFRVLSARVLHALTSSHGMRHAPLLVVRPPVFERAEAILDTSLVATSGCVSPMRVTWHVYIAGSWEYGPLPPCASIEVTVTAPDGTVLLEGGERTGNLEMEVTEAGTYLLEAESFIEGALVGSTTAPVEVSPIYGMSTAIEPVEIEAGTQASLTLTLQCPPDEPLVVSLEASEPSKIDVPESVTVEAGATSAELAVSVSETARCSSRYSITATAQGYTVAIADFTIWRQPTISWRYGSAPAPVAGRPIVDLDNMVASVDCAPEDRTTLHWRLEPVGEDGREPIQCDAEYLYDGSDFRITVDETEAVKLLLGDWQLLAEVDSWGVESNGLAVSVHRCPVELWVSSVRLVRGEDGAFPIFGSRRLELWFQVNIGGFRRVHRVPASGVFSMGSHTGRVSGQPRRVDQLLEEVVVPVPGEREFEAIVEAFEQDSGVNMASDYGRASETLTVECEVRNFPVRIIVYQDAASRSDIRTNVAGLGESSSSLTVYDDEVTISIESGESSGPPRDNITIVEVVLSSRPAIELNP